MYNKIIIKLIYKIVIIYFFNIDIGDDTNILNLNEDLLLKYKKCIIVVGGVLLTIGIIYFCLKNNIPPSEVSSPISLPDKAENVDTITAEYQEDFNTVMDDVLDSYTDVLLKQHKQEV